MSIDIQQKQFDIGLLQIDFGTMLIDILQIQTNIGTM